MAPDQPDRPDEPDLDFHGDRELADGLVDLAVNVRPSTPPPWLREVIRAITQRFTLAPDRPQGERMRRRSVVLAPSREGSIIPRTR